MHPVAILLLAIAVVLLSILVLRLHAFVALLLAALLVAGLTPTARLRDYAQDQVDKGDWTEEQANDFVDEETIGSRVADGFGHTCAGIGILIALASIIGRCLLDSGGADRIVRSMLWCVGEARAGIAFVASGFVLGIPVFFDTVFYLMIPLGKATFLRTRRNYLFYILTIVAGATMAHSLVPPTPGPLLVVEQLDVDLLKMIVGGCLVGACASAAGYGFAWWLNRRMVIPLREGDGEVATEARPATADPLPPLSLSLLPIVLPVVLIGASSAVSLGWPETPADRLPAWVRLAQTLGDKNVALLLAAAAAVALLLGSRRLSRSQLAEKLQSALSSAGTIILITAAGGAFGSAIRQSGIASVIAGGLSETQPLLLLPLAFGVTAMVRTAQGSATVAMITAANILQGLADPERLTFDVVYLALAIGCGSKPIAWMADSGFWVICKMSGMTESEGLRTVTPMSVVMGVAGLIATIVGAMLLPLK